MRAVEKYKRRDRREATVLGAARAEAHSRELDGMYRDDVEEEDHPRRLLEVGTYQGFAGERPWAEESDEHTRWWKQTAPWRVHHLVVAGAAVPAAVNTTLADLIRKRVTDIEEHFELTIRNATEKRPPC